MISIFSVRTTSFLSFVMCFRSVNLALLVSAVIFAVSLLPPHASAGIHVAIDWTAGTEPTDFGYSTNHPTVDNIAGTWTNNVGSPSLHEQNQLVNSLDDAATTPFVHGYADIRHISFDAKPQSVFIIGFRKDSDILFDLTATQNELQLAHGAFSPRVNIPIVNNDGQEHRYGWELDRAASMLKVFYDDQQIGDPGGYSVSTTVTDTEHWFGDREGNANNWEEWSSFFIEHGPFGNPDVSSPEWIKSGIGDWHSSANWTSGGPADDNSQTAVFGTSISATTLVGLNTPVTINGIEFSNQNNVYVIGGYGSVNLQANSSVDPVVSVDGTHEFQARVNLLDETTANVTNNSTLILNNALDLMGNHLIKSGAGELALRNDLLTSGGTILIQEGIVSGNGTVSGDLTNDGGTISPGNSAAGVASAVPEPSTCVLMFMSVATLLNIYFWRRGHMSRF